MLHVFLFILTFLTMTFREFLLPGIILGDFPLLARIFFLEYPYSIGLITILFCHEMGHYLPARYYGVRASLPYFIPIPFGPVGTMGAVIQIKDRIPDKRKLFDIGVGGPLMSLILSVIAWVVGLYWSELVRIDSTEVNLEGMFFFGDSLFTYWTGQWIFGSYNAQEFDILLHPLAKAGWVGLLVTAINLFPFGQLDGGHIIYAVFGEKYRNWIYYLFFSFLILGMWNFTWLVWALIIFYLIQVEHPYVSDPFDHKIEIERKALGIFMLISLVFIFVPDPIILGSERNDQNLLQWLFGLGRSIGF